MIDITFDEVFTFENLYQAHMRGRLAKRDKKPLVRFETAMLANLYSLYHRLSNGTYKIRGYSHFTVCEPKRREIQTLRYPDRVVQHVLCDLVLAPYFTRHAIVDNTVCQKGKGTHFALRRFEEKLAKFTRKNGNEGYILKCDILKYFPSIPHAKLKEVFCTHIRDEKIKNLVEHIIDSYHTSAEFLEKNGIPLISSDRVLTDRGVPIGNQTSQVFGMFYLDKLDRYIKEQLRVKIYARYMDDFVLVHRDKAFLQQALKKIQSLVGEFGLVLNDKTQIAPLKNGITFLGFRYCVTPTGKIIKTVKKQTKRRLRWRAKLLKKAAIEEIIIPERVSQALAAFHGHLKYCKSYKLEHELYNKLHTFSAEAING